MATDRIVRWGDRILVQSAHTATAVMREWEQLKINCSMAGKGQAQGLQLRKLPREGKKHKINS